MKISVIMATARDDYPIVGLPDTFIFEPTLESLKQQTFSDFEFIIVDALYDFRKNYFKDKKLPFPIKHIKPKPSVWDKVGAWRVCNQLNTAITHAEGELIIRIDDCCSFGPEFLEKFWTWHKRGFFAQALVIYHHGTEPMRNTAETKKLYYETYKLQETYEELAKKLDTLYKPGEIIRDSRWRFLDGKGVALGDMRCWYYGYGSASLDALLKLNGYDENFDGCKSLEEMDLGLRLYMAGYQDLIMDESLTVIEHFHKAVSRKAVWYEGKPPKCNYALYLINMNDERYRANSDKLTNEQLKFVWEESCREPCSHCGGDDYDYEMFKFWASNQRTFDLAEERERFLSL